MALKVCLFKQGSKPTIWCHEIKINGRLKIISENTNPRKPTADFYQHKLITKIPKGLEALQHQEV